MLQLISQTRMLIGHCVILFCLNLPQLSAQVCLTSPIITCPPSFFGCPGDNISPETIGFAMAAPGDVNCPMPVLTYRDSTMSSNSCGSGSEIRRIWTARYPDGLYPSLIAKCTQVLVLRDVEPPIISNCPPNILVATDTSCTATVHWDLPSVSDDCGIMGFTSNYNSGSSFYPGVTTVTYTATDHCGKISTCSFTVTVESTCCNDSPSLTIPNDFAGCPNTNIDPSVTGTASASLSGTNCGEPEISYSDVITSNGDCPGEVVVQRTWNAINPDHPNSSSSGIQWITLIDNTTPSIMNCPTDITVASDSDCSALVSWLEPTANDNCGIVSFTSNYSPGASFDLGTTFVRYTAVDVCGNMSECSFKVVVIGNCCNGIPELTIPVDFSGCPGTSVEPDITGQATAVLSGGGCDLPMIIYSDRITDNGDCSLTIERTWTASNPNHTGQDTSAIQIITLSDSTAPIISNCPSNITVVSNADCYAIVNWILPEASDNCGIVAFFNNLPTGSGSRFEIGTTTVIYTAEDGCGNTAQCTFDVTVLPNCCESEVNIECPRDYSACPGTSIDPDVTGWASASSTVVCPVTITYFDQSNSYGPCNGARTIDRYWIATRDGHTESDTCIQRITLKDTQPPAIVTCPPNVVRNYDNRVYSWADPVVHDNCSFSISYSIPKGTTFPIGVTVVNVVATDACGNQNTCQFTVTINPPIEPSGLNVICPEDLIIDCGAILSGPVPRPEVATDCPICPDTDIPGFVFMGSLDGHKYYCSREKMIWQDAQAFSASKGGHLAIINDARENAFLANILEVNSAYIGLSDYEQEGEFKWVDGSAPGYTKWYPHQPNNYNNSQDFVELLRNGYWNDQYNDKKLEFIMEIPCIEIVQTSGPENFSEVTGTTTVTFDIFDMCRQVGSCSYNIIVSNEVSFICPDDKEVITSSEETVVYFESPKFMTCCSNCNHGREIPGFVYMGKHNGSYYYCSKDKAKWHDANATARRIGGHLAIIESQGENTYLAQLLNQTIAFIGISDHAEEGNWKTVNGDKQEYFNWRYDNPNNYQGIQHYVELEPSGKWNDNTGTYKREYIVEIKGCGTVRQTAGIPSGGFFPKGTTHIAFEASDYCGNSKMCSFDVLVKKESVNTVDYCDSYGEQSNRGYIDKVEIGNFVHSSGNNNGYLDFQENCTVVKKGSSFKLRITPGWGIYRYYAYYKIFIDFNRDGDFNDTGEYVGKGHSGNSVSGDIEIPGHALTGKTRMRIIMSLMGYEDACGSYYFGETEDYCLNISGVISSESPKAKGKNTFISHTIELEGTNEYTGSKSSAIFPNPASYNFHIASEEIIARLEVIGIDGIIRMSVRNPSGPIDVSNLSSGLYLVRMIDDAGLEIHEKIIIE